MGKYRIMTFDGGGLRGVLTATLVKRITDEFPSLCKNAHLLAGTSTGSLIALGLAYGLKPQDLIDLYRDKAKFIFTPRYPELFRPKYDNKNLRMALSSIFPARLRLRDLKHRVIVPSFRVVGGDSGYWAPVFFNNFPGSPTRNEYVIDVALCSSAAPTYFPSYNGFVDGGVVVNDPSTAAIAIAVDRLAGHQKLEDIHLISIGTGFNSYHITADTTQWGIFQWMLSLSPPSPLLTMLIDGKVGTEAYFSSILLNERYLRLNPMLPNPIPLDAYGRIDEIVDLANSYDLRPAINWVKRHWCNWC